MTPEDLIRFHNGDTLHNIPVVRLPPPANPHPRQAWRKVAATVAGATLAGVLGGWVIGKTVGGAVAGRPASASSGQPAVTTTAPSPTPTVTVRQAQPVPEPAPSWRREPSAGMELVHVIISPATGGDPSMDYCITYRLGIGRQSRCCPACEPPALPVRGLPFLHPPPGHDQCVGGVPTRLLRHPWRPGSPPVVRRVDHLVRQ